MVANEQHDQRRRDEERRAEHEREDRDRQRRLVDRDEAEHDDARGESDRRGPRRTEAVADEASRNKPIRPVSPISASRLPANSGIDAAILREGRDVRGDEEIVEAADRIDREEQPELRECDRLANAKPPRTTAAA